MKLSHAFPIAALVCAAQVAMASPFTSTSPTGFDVTTVGASTVGGIVVQLTGTNGSVIISQLAASTLYEGFANAEPLTIGTQAGWGDAVTSALGGGLASAYFRFSLFDGDTAAGNFDFNNNTLLVNGVSAGNWSTPNAQNTDGVGAALAPGFSGGGFRNNLLDTGWFSLTNAASLAALYSAIDASNSLSFQLSDTDPFDNFYDFTLGIDASLINVGTGPVVNPPTGVPEPASVALLSLALAGLGLSRRRKV